MAGIQCSVDFEVIDNEDEVVATPCGHLFHQHCVTEWLQDNETCPQCRANLNSNQLLRLYLTINDEELRRLRRRQEEMERELHRSQSNRTEDPETLCQLESTELALCEERDINAVRSQEFENLSVELRVTKENLNSITSQLEFKKEKVQEITSQLDETKVIIAQLTTSIASAQEETNTYKAKLEEAEGNTKLFSEELEKAREEISIQNQLIESLNTFQEEKEACTQKIQEVKEICESLNVGLEDVEQGTINYTLQMQEAETSESDQEREGSTNSSEQLQDLQDYFDAEMDHEQNGTDSDATDIEQAKDSSSLSEVSGGSRQEVVSLQNQLTQVFSNFKVMIKVVGKLKADNQRIRQQLKKTQVKMKKQKSVLKRQEQESETYKQELEAMKEAQRDNDFTHHGLPRVLPTLTQIKMKSQADISCLKFESAEESAKCVQRLIEFHREDTMSLSRLRKETFGNQEHETLVPDANDHDIDECKVGDSHDDRLSSPIPSDDDLLMFPITSYDVRLSSPTTSDDDSREEDSTKKTSHSVQCSTED